MNRTSVQTILTQQFADGALIENTGGVLAEVWPVTNFTSRGRPGTVQTVEITEPGMNGTLRVKIWDQPEIPGAAKGGWIEFVAKSTNKGPSGLKVKYDEYNGVRRVELHVQRSAFVRLAQPQATPQPQVVSPVMPQSPVIPPAPLPQPTPPPPPAPPVHAPVTQAVPVHAPAVQSRPQSATWAEYGACANAVAAAYSAMLVKAIRVAAYVEQETGVRLPVESIPSIAATLFIEMNRRHPIIPQNPWNELAAHLVGRRQHQSETPPPPPAPEPSPAPIVPVVEANDSDEIPF